MKILLDNGHGADTAGKRSPDGRLLEYRYAREIAQEVENQLRSRGYDAERIVMEKNDVSLRERCRRVNQICKEVGKENVLLVSIHCNAAGNGDWMSARGWSAYTSRGETKSDKLATALYYAAAHYFPAGTKIRTDKTDGDPDIEAGFYILKNTNCSAVLTENFFQDNKEDVEYLLSQEGRETIAKVHVEGIEAFIRQEE